MAGSLTAEFEGLQAKVTATLQSIDANFSRANDLAAEMFPLVRDFVKQLASADDASATWHDAFLDVAGLKEPPEDEEAPASSATRSAMPPTTPAAKTPSRFAGAGDATPDLSASDLSSVRPGTASRGPPRRDGLTLFSPPVSTPFLRPARTPGHVSGYERGSLVRGDPLATPPPSVRPGPGALTAADLDASPAGSAGGSAGGAMASPATGADDDDDGVAPSPELASPEMPAISCRAASLISALDGPGGEPAWPTGATSSAGVAASGARPRTMADAALVPGGSGMWGTEAAIDTDEDEDDGATTAASAAAGGAASSSASEVSDALSRQGVDGVTADRAETLLAALESSGFLKSFRDNGVRRWRAFSDDE